MLKTRVIPVLLLKDNGLYKGERFKNHTYVGDPINTVKLFNEKEVDELIILDITATVKNKPINFKLLENLANEAFMPLAYGGGINNIGDIERLFTLGVEKIILNTYAIENIDFIKEVSLIYGSQSIVIAIDVKKNWRNNYKVYSTSGTVRTIYSPLDIADQMQKMGAGEILLNSIDNDGLYTGYNIELIDKLSQKLTIPLIACGGAANLEDFVRARNAGASAVAAGSMFIYHGPHKAVLISYPKYEQLQMLFKS